MSTSIDWSWAFYTIAGVLACAAWWLGWRALFHDRARGRKRCPKCWYDLSGLMAIDEPEVPARESWPVPNAPSELPRCPECGHVASKMKHLSRTRRRWKLALLALVVMLLSVGSVLMPTVRKYGWYGVIPLRSFKYIRAVLSPAQYQSFQQYLDARMRTMDADELLALVASDPDALRIRLTWPVGVKPAVPTTNGGVPLQIEIAPDVPRPTNSPRGQFDSWNAPWTDHLLELSAAREFVRVRVSHLWKGNVGEFEWRIKHQGTLHDYLQPVSDPSVDSALASALRPRLTAKLAPNGTFEGPMSIHLAAVKLPRWPDLTIAMRVEVCDDQRVLGSARWWYRANDEYATSTALAITGDLSAPLADPTNPRYTVRFTGDGEMALRDFDATKYWKGSFTIPFADLIPKR